MIVRKLSNEATQREHIDTHTVHKFIHLYIFVCFYVTDSHGTENKIK